MLLKYFWSDTSAIPPELYTANFSAGHIAWVLVVLAALPAAAVLCRRLPEARRARLMKALALTALLCEISQLVWQALIGAFTVQYSLPLQLCDIAVFVEFAAVWQSRPARAGAPQRYGVLAEFSYAVCMPAAFAALLTPGWYFPLFSFGYLRAALMHALLVLIPVLLVWGDGFRPDIRRLPKVALLFVLFIAMAVTANLFLKSNYMFLSYVPPDTALVIFETWFGNPGYEIPELLLLLLLWAVLYIPWLISARRAGEGR